MRAGDETLIVPRYGGVLAGPDQLRQVFNDTDAKVLWLIVGVPENWNFWKAQSPSGPITHPSNRLPKQLAGV